MVRWWSKLKKRSSDYHWTTTSCRSRRLSPANGDATVSDRQDRLSGFSTAKLAAARLLLIGAGGLASHVACGLTRKGAGELIIVDHDTCEMSNLNRQTYLARDIGKPKALRLAKRATQLGFLGTRCVGHHVAFTAENASVLLTGVSAVVCGVDNNQTRQIASVACRRRAIPCLQLAVNENADFGWLFVQEADETSACVGCVFPRIANGEGRRERCRPVPSNLDILLCLAGFTLHAIDTVLMQRERAWNYRGVHLVAGAHEGIVPKRPGCPLCDGKPLSPKVNGIPLRNSLHKKP